MHTTHKLKRLSFPRLSQMASANLKMPYFVTRHCSSIPLNFPPTFTGKPFQVTETDFNAYEFLNADDESFKKLPPPMEMPLFSSSNYALHSSALFRLSSRFGAKTLDEVWANILGLKQFLNEAPTQEFFDRIFQNELTPSLVIYGEVVDKLDEVPHQFRWMEEKLRLHGELGNFEKTFPYRKEYVHALMPYDKSDHKKFHQMFVVDPKETPKIDFFKCHVLVKAMLAELYTSHMLNKLDDVINFFDEMMMSIKKGITIDIMTAKDPSEDEKAQLKKFALTHVAPELRNNIIRFKWDTQRNLLGGFRMVVMGMFIDNSLQTRFDDIFNGIL